MNARWTLLIAAALLLVFVVSPLHTAYGQDPNPSSSTSTSTSSSTSSNSTPSNSTPSNSTPSNSTPSVLPIVPFVEPSPDIPAAYVLRVIICDIPVFESPAGVVIPGANVFAGQTFYADPFDTIAADGSHWTQLFDGAFAYPFIPSVCVQ